MDALTPISRARTFWSLLAIGLLVVLAGWSAAHQMDTQGHVITGMTNQVVWGLPHVFAIFMIVTASGVLNVASVGSVFGQSAYKTRAPLSGLLSLALLAGGLMVLMLDLGRPERVIIAATHYNFVSVFAWNIFLYSGMAAIVGIYLWITLERRMNRFSQPVGIAALIWRFVLTTGTGSIFGFLIARQAYQSAVLAPLFIVLSLAWGMAVFSVVQSAVYAWNKGTLQPAIRRRMSRLLAIFLSLALYLVAVVHLTNLYFAKQLDFELFILLGRGDASGVFPILFWIGYVLIGSVVPIVLLFFAREDRPRLALLASVLVVAGAFAFLFVFIVGGQAFPLDIFPGHEVTSSFADGAFELYRPRWPEWLLGLGGLGVAFVLTLIGVRVLDTIPQDEASS